MDVEFPSIRKVGKEVHTIRTERQVTNVYNKRKVHETDITHTSPHSDKYLCTTPSADDGIRKLRLKVSDIKWEKKKNRQCRRELFFANKTNRSDEPTPL